MPKATEKEIAITDWAWRASLVFAGADPTPLERSEDCLTGVVEDGAGILHECCIPLESPPPYNFIPWAQQIVVKFLDSTIRKPKCEC